MTTSLPSYPPGSVRALIDTDLVTPATRRALRARLAEPVVESPSFFTAEAFSTAGAVCDRLIPQPERPRPIDVTGTLDTRLARIAAGTGAGNGWRYAIMPPVPDMHAQGMTGIEQAANVLFEGGFTTLSDANRDDVLHAVQRGAAPGAVWAAMDGSRYFEELLSVVTDIYYAHPLASEEIGYAGMADAHGWHTVGFGAREAHEPVAEAAK